jgi:hypothetical protein
MSFEEVKEKFYDYSHDVSKISSILDQTDEFILERFLNVDNTDQINSVEIKKEPTLSYSITQTPESTKKVAFFNLKGKKCSINSIKMNPLVASSGVSSRSTLLAPQSAKNSTHSGLNDLGDGLDLVGSMVDLLGEDVLILPEKYSTNNFNQNMFKKNNELKLPEQSIEDSSGRVRVINNNVELKKCKQVKSDFVVLPLKITRKKVFITNNHVDNFFYVRSCPASNASLFAETILKKEIDVRNMTVDDVFQEYKYFLDDMMGEDIKNMIHYNEKVKNLLHVFKDMYRDIIEPIILVKLKQYGEKPGY